ncbi:hypothetical protein KCP77_01840 [Salmonella enterica subsp. enterica]|nr:hypothetical protein KCP77_01840 [Salmonella enterica subsp. enterica]
MVKIEYRRRHSVLAKSGWLTASARLLRASVLKDLVAIINGMDLDE